MLGVPVIGIAWQAFSASRSVSQPGLLPRSGGHTDMFLSIGSWSVSGGKMWLVVGGFGIVAVLLAFLGVGLVMLSSEPRE